MIIIMVMMEMVTVNTINLNFDRGNNDRYHHHYGCGDDVTTDNFMAKESVKKFKIYSCSR